MRQIVAGFASGKAIGLELRCEIVGWFVQQGLEVSIDVAVAMVRLVRESRCELQKGDRPGEQVRFEAQL